MAFKPYQDEETVIGVVSPMNDTNTLVFENRLDRVSIHGSIDITNDQRGLRAIEQVKAAVDRIHAALNNQKHALPKKIEVLEPKKRKNPFA